mmetsp:Transcript_5984/g.19530  ORF Transcript_5984/g.19530 Transcript_5984/m.19530 type:complete len:220 (+) Transcript_5984:718-1377(+)
MRQLWLLSQHCADATLNGSKQRVLGGLRLGLVGVKGRVATQHGKEEGAQRPVVDGDRVAQVWTAATAGYAASLCRCPRLGRPHNLGGHVQRRAAQRGHGLFVGDEACKPKVGKFARVGADPDEQHVLRLQVSMHNVQAVQVRHRPSNVTKDVAGRRLSHCPVARQPTKEVAARTVLHEQVHGPLLHPPVLQLHNVRVPYPSQHVHLPLDAGRRHCLAAR